LRQLPTHEVRSRSEEMHHPLGRARNLHADL
jgi:hypothetical protein